MSMRHEGAFDRGGCGDVAIGQLPKGYGQQSRDSGRQFGGSQLGGIAAPTAPIPASMDRLRESLSKLGQGLFAVRERLERQLRPLPPEKASEDAGENAPVRSPMVNEIESLVQEVNSRNLVIADILNRLEV
jgi:hypothetical protein